MAVNELNELDILYTEIDNTRCKYNILLGVLNYQNKIQKNMQNTINKCDDKCILVDCMNDGMNDSICIPLNYVLANACNYLPKLDIQINSKSLQSCFKVI